ncbi:hypothetical protein CLV62_14326 [Dysgonomonas alginatilytica]|uniref:BetR domain-containing protein n=1 Tax=Dysgonomonas alginatilytica TaxID=1605892 RepID=A0A2V3PKG0_9BACT|nr:hypothetical protein [Dysgonomonas alginatilytica]PXV58846.1 hypothetical protein CLV62_14326 [Dysgonomonas alginatilytica]
MANNKINTNGPYSTFIEKIKNVITGSIVETLEEIIPLSKVAIYRRLQGTVLFSLPEAFQIARKFQISLDEITFENSNNYLFRVNKPSNLSLEDTYADFITFGVSNINDYLDKGEGHLYLAGSGLPIAFALNYDCLMKFRYFKWLHENRGMAINQKKFSETVLPQKLYDISIAFMNQLKHVESTFILSDAMLGNYLKEINHFMSLGLFEQPEIELIKETLHELINEFQIVVASGRNKNGANIHVYLTDINIDSTFGYLDKGKLDFTFSKIFGMNYATSQNKEIFSMYKSAFEDLKDYATLITRSSSARRSSFFKEQHRLIDEVLSK